MKSNIINEKYNLVRQNYWTGLRFPDDRKSGYNWTLYYCLLRIVNNGPLDIVMHLINEFLNWIPAGCWRISKIYADSCETCGCGCWGGNNILVPIDFCSFECLEKNKRNEIISNQLSIIHIMNLFKDYPEAAMQDMNDVLNDLNGIFPIIWIYNYSDYE
jgi:hypothetical protein